MPFLVGGVLTTIAWIGALRHAVRQYGWKRIFLSPFFPWML
jgi:hypothetical protein